MRFSFLRIHPYNSHVQDPTDLIYSSEPQNAYFEDPSPSVTETKELFDDSFGTPMKKGRAVPQAPKKLSKNKMLTIASTLVAAAIGGFSIVNPLLNRPTLTKEKYTRPAPNEIHYSFSFSATPSYSCSLSLQKGEEVLKTVSLSGRQSYEGSFFLETYGEYAVYFDATNKVDYYIHQLKYTVTFTEE